MEIKSLLEMHGQSHLMRDYMQWNEAERKQFEQQIGQIDWSIFESMNAVWEENSGDISPIEGLSLREIETHRSEYLKIGTEAIRQGKIIAVLLAGGQGTRLGTSSPKGTYNIGITRPLYIFEQLIDNLKKVCTQCDAYVPLLIMTSEKNDEETRTFFAKHSYFGYPASHVRFFVQEMAPCVDFSGKLLLEGRGKVATSPNGNGGWYRSLERAGLLKDRLLSNAEWFNVVAVDNVLQRIADPVFVGATIVSGKKCGAKFVRKNHPEEKVGLLCQRDGLPCVVEYYELPERLARLQDSSGELVYSYGVTLNYLFHASTLAEIASQKIPVHTVKKKISFLNEDGMLTEPDEVNGYKFETLILDMVRLMGSCLPYEAEREKEFAPVKNKTGVDSVETAQKLLLLNGVIL